MRQLLLGSLLAMVSFGAACGPDTASSQDQGDVSGDQQNDLKKKKKDAGVDAGPVDAGKPDAGPMDAGSVDAGSVDAGSVDAGAHDAGEPDAGGVDAGPSTGRPAIFTLVFENHDYQEIVGSTNAPFFNELIAKYGLATNYSDCNIHPSLPNYLCMISGAPQYPGGTDLLPTSSFLGGSFPVNAEHLGTQLIAANVPFKAYQESMGTACKLKNSGSYATKHDPFLYFQDIQLGANSECADTNVDLTAFAADLANDVNRYAFITPNLTSDGHDPSSNPTLALQNSDTWARAQVGAIMASAAYKNGGVIFITWDEAEGRGGRSRDQVPMIIVSEKLVSQGFKSAKAYSHKSYLATVEDLLGLPRLPAVRNEPSMTEFFAP